MDELFKPVASTAQSVLRHNGGRLNHVICIRLLNVPIGNRAPGDLFEMLQCAIKLEHRSVTPLDVGRVPTNN